MTPTHIPVVVPLFFKQHIHRVPGVKKHLLYKCIKHHPFDKAAVHDLQLKLTALGLWSTTIFNNNNDNNNNGNNGTLNITVDPYSQDIRLDKQVKEELGRRVERYDMILAEAIQIYRYLTI